MLTPIIISLFVSWMISAGAIFVYSKKIKSEQKLFEWQTYQKLLKDFTQKHLQKQDEIRQQESHLKALKSDLQDRINNQIQIESKIQEREEKLTKKFEEIDKKYTTLQEERSKIQDLELELNKERSTIRASIEKIAHLSIEEAREQILQETESIYEGDILKLIDKKKKDLQIREKEISREILIKAIQNYAGDLTAEVTQTIVNLENDDIKWKLIGKEGRNIIAFERATWVSLIIDDTPDVVFLSSFDLFRRYIAKRSLDELITDKRIQPARIEEIVEKNQNEAEELIKDLGQKTLEEMEIYDLPEGIAPLIGKLRFRTSYGQNIILHSKEVAYIARSIAQLIGANEELAYRGGLLHDIGKALDHDIEWTHPELGGKLARKYGLSEELTNIIEGHHDGVPCIYIETKIVQIADAISAVRPGARRMNSDDYLKRVQEMEGIAMSYSGVEKAFALQAGREIRIFVDADEISDIDSLALARNIASEIEEKLSYPGEVKVNLIREKRVIEYAR